MARFSFSALLTRHARPALFVGIILVATVWIASGVATREAPESPAAGERGPMTVAVRGSTAEPVERVLVLQGQVEPEQRVTVRAETAGQVAEWHVPRGASVDADTELLRLRMDDREARRRQAIAQLRGRESEYAAKRELFEDGYATRLELEAEEAQVEAARAELEAIELDIRNTRIHSPISGVVNVREAERGDYVGVGEAVAEIVDNDPLLAVVQVPQHQIGRVRIGQRARIRFLDGRAAEGEVRFAATVAEPATRTFRVEIEVPNPERDFPSGISTGVEIPTDEVPAHKVSPALIGLDESGQVGVKTVEEGHRVAFHPVEVVRTARDGVWVTGLPERARIITVGQGFVTTGERVRAVEQDPLARGAAGNGATP
ncbi:efflux RND transporter periplasmic adaptor subunit [Aquisalimonas sp.]|uniref:efflux RND transporter periplasmic adaptor subunit n=1 Tax=Aquisalimonas sp. TaxID=1872621 RepID=UPI0025C5B7A9|nr:efflux RND transporter periplasmic adaptor subunit [Aquisalimonas sp.]